MKWFQLKKWWGLHAGARFFVSLAAICLIPVIALGTVLATQYRHELRERGISQGRLQAALISRVITDTELDQPDLTDGVTLAERTRLDRLADTEVDSGIITRFRLRSPDLHVVYSSDGSGLRFGPADGDRSGLEGDSAANVLSALKGASPALIAQRTGEPVIEAFSPLYNFRTHQLIGVLQIDLPYGPIAAQLARGLHKLYLNLAAGLLALYIVLGALVWWATGELARSAAKFEHQALHDALTDLPNRALFTDRITQTAAIIERGGGIFLGPGRRGGGAAVVLIDLDGFRKINDAVGQVNGDLLLTTMAERLRRTVRAVDTVAGLGGDRFGLVLAGVEHQDQIGAAVTRIRAAIEAEIVFEDVPIRPKASIGVAFLPRNGTRADQLIARADVALDVAKRTQGGLVCYDEEQDGYSPDRLALIGQLRQAVDRNQLVLHYQPKVTQPDGHVHCLEALVRWEHPSRGLLPPDHFVPLAEQTGLIDDLTRWVLVTALRQLQQWRVTRPELSVAVNISERTLLHLDLPQMVIDALAETGSEPGSLVLEIAETALAGSPERAALIMGHLDAVGVRLSLDDFGQGFTSLSQLADLPLDELKIDTSFVMNMNLHPGDAAIVRSVVDMGHHLGLDVVAEGVESIDSLDAVVAMGTDICQGYFFSRPVPAEEIMTWLDEHAAVSEPSEDQAT